MAGADARVSMFYVRSTGDTESVRSELINLLPTYKVRSMAEYSSLMTSSNLPELKPFIRSFIALGVAISFMVVLLTMHTMVLERTRDIGILKALGIVAPGNLWTDCRRDFGDGRTWSGIRIAKHVRRRCGPPSNVSNTPD